MMSLMCGRLGGITSRFVRERNVLVVGEKVWILDGGSIS